MDKTCGFYHLRLNLFAGGVRFGVCVKRYGANPYQLILYRNMAVFMEVADLVVLFVMGTLKKRSEKRTL